MQIFCNTIFQQYVETVLCSSDVQAIDQVAMLLGNLAAD